MTTLTKDAVNKFNEWSKYLNMITRFNVAKVNSNTLFGRIIIEGFKADPEAAIKMIQDQASDNYEMVKSVIGEYNLKLLTS